MKEALFRCGAFFSVCYNSVMKKILGLFCLCLPLSVSAFSDQASIPSWATQSIDTLVESGVFSGNPDGTFAPLRPLNRAEFCKLLAQATYTDLYEDQIESFPDVQYDDWFFPYVETAKQEGWLAGYPDGRFRPENTINRAEVAKILSAVLALPEESPQAGEEWFEPYFRALDSVDLLAHGSEIDSTKAALNPTRAEIAEQLFRFQEYLMRSDEKASEDDMEASLLEEEVLEMEEVFEAPVVERKINPDDYVAPAAPVSKISGNAGDLKITKDSQLQRSYEVSAGASSVKAHSLFFSVQGSPVEVKSIQFRRVGNGSSDDFDHVWIEVDGVTRSEKVFVSSDDLADIVFSTPLTVRSGIHNITLWVDVAADAGVSSSRFVLFLPEWIGANAQNRMGFFPFGGADIVIKP